MSDGYPSKRRDDDNCIEPVDHVIARADPEDSVIVIMRKSVDTAIAQVLLCIQILHFIEWGLIAKKIRKKGEMGLFARLFFLCYADYGLTIR